MWGCKGGACFDMKNTNNLVAVFAAVLMLCAVASFIGALYFVPMCPNEGAQFGVMICGAIAAICGGGAAVLIMEE